MKLLKWKHLLKKELEKLSKWDDAEIILAYYLVEAKKGQTKRKYAKKDSLNWWGKLYPKKKMNFIDRLYEEESNTSHLLK